MRGLQGAESRELGSSRHRRHGPGSHQQPVLLPLGLLRRNWRDPHHLFSPWPLLKWPKRARSRHPARHGLRVGAKTPLAEPKRLQRTKKKMFGGCCKQNHFLPSCLTFINITGAAVWGVTGFTTSEALEESSAGGAVTGPAQKAVCSLLRLISVFPAQMQAEAHSPRCWFREAADLGTAVRALGQPLCFPDVERLRLNLPRQKAARSSTFPSLFFLPLSLFKTIPGSLHHLTDFPN